MSKPKIRFKGYEEDWEQRKVSELCSISTGKSNTQDKVEDGEYPFYVRSPIIERSTKYLYDEEAVITVGDGVGTGKVFHYVNGKYDLHQRCYRMYGFSDELNAHYFYHTFSKLFYKRVMAMTAKTSVDSVRLEMISGMKIPVPNVEEQRKIGSFLDGIDNLITLHQRKCEETKKLKKYMLQKMFPQNGKRVPEIRFAGFTDDWEQRKYESFCSIVTKQTGFDYTATIKNALVQEFSDETLPYLQTKNFTGTTIDYDTDYYIPKSVAKKFPKINLDEKCILFSIVGASVGNIGLFPGDKHCFLSGAICVSKFLDETDADYLYHFMCSESGQSQIKTCTKGGAQATVTIEDIRNFTVKMPSKAERNKIGGYLTTLDHLITLHQRKYEELQKIKKFMLQNMFI